MLHVVHVLPVLGVGGAERLALRLAGASPGGRHTLVVLGPEDALTASARAQGLEVLHLGMTQATGLPLALWHLVRTLRRLQPDVVHTWMPHGNLIGGLAARWVGVPTVWSVHHSSTKTLGAYGTADAVDRVCRRTAGLLAESVVFTSHSAFDALHALYRGPRPVVIVNPAPDGHPEDGARERARSRLGLTATELVVGNVGRDHAQKDRRTHAAAAVLLDTQVPGVRHVFVGAGLTPGTWLDRDWDASLRRPLMHGPVPEARMVVAAFDVLALTSAFGETAPLVLSESLTAGVPVVATDVGDVRELIGPGGLAVPAGDTAQFARALATVLRMSPSDRAAMGAAGRAHVQATYRAGDAWRQYADVYHTAAARGPDTHRRRR